ncbi:hypothetical protein GUJ93_ZPchr0151g33460 [Zizania palustris]|uniref:Uncharacterized protein n=1 Tax=Zizania palustris TaxID=103762 RepID=A0A8J5RQE2_ZIZPA|nr:hypothetical protein GUJ93_ZPchr0151g33460 [Zizania palustris]
MHGAPPTCRHRFATGSQIAGADKPAAPLQNPPSIPSKKQAPFARFHHVYAPAACFPSDPVIGEPRLTGIRFY